MLQSGMNVFLCLQSLARKAPPFALCCACLGTETRSCRGTRYGCLNGQVTVGVAKVRSEVNQG